MEYSRSGKQRTTIYYCHPYCASERGSNENQNSFIRRFIPKGTPISQYSTQYIKETQDYINNYPRRILNGTSSAKLFQKELEKLQLSKKFIYF
jgi:IS30 family transposase